MGKRCYNGGEKHRFMPRYDEVSLADEVRVGKVYMDPKDFRSLIVRKVYIKDICEWCGDEIKKS